jgi:hypothetical protein
MRMTRKLAIALILATAGAVTAPAALAGQLVQANDMQKSMIIVVGGKASLNPQPLPPKDHIRVRRSLTGPGSEVSLNPQPLPPKEFGLR